jgi:hypothetical protein
MAFTVDLGIPFCVLPLPCTSVRESIYANGRSCKEQALVRDIPRWRVSGTHRMRASAKGWGQWVCFSASALSIT